MTNVLPPEVQKKVWGYYRMRFIFVGSIVVILTCIIALSSLIPAYLVLRGSRPVVEGLQESPIDAQADRLATNRLNGLVKQVLPVFAATSTPLEVMGTALSVRPKGVTINRIVYNAKSATLTLTGVTQSRDATNQYRQALQDTNKFKSVTVPVSNLVGSAGSQLTITLAGFN